MTQHSMRLLSGSLDLEKALVCDDAITRVLARYADSDASRGMTDWFNAEIRRADFDPHALFIGMAAMMVQMHSSFAAYCYRTEAGELLAKQFKSVVDQSYASHFADTHAAAEGLR
ncbi:hypothetical protein ACO34A_13255 [Rhizobium sp. ACO-34A]|nr:hypothetical protein [Rhizobium sp. ACO-34A]ATN34768.1 hypothetical protein ACO34A_13255 [Rhizobium sp. ACO-34A]